jgi:hypothetical protein
MCQSWKGLEDVLNAGLEEQTSVSRHRLAVIRGCGLEERPGRLRVAAVDGGEELLNHRLALVGRHLGHS